MWGLLALFRRCGWCVFRGFGLGGGGCWFLVGVVGVVCGLVFVVFGGWWGCLWVWGGWGMRLGVAFVGCGGIYMLLVGFWVVWWWVGGGWRSGCVRGGAVMLSGGL